MKRLLLLVCGMFAVVTAAQALDYRSIEPGAAILYDAPSQKGKKLYLIKAQSPIEVLIRLEGWTKVRDAEGSIAWVESKHLVDRRTVIVTAAKADVRQADRPDSPLVLEADKWVVFELLEPAAKGWAKVKHRDGGVGYVRTSQVWGL